MSRYVNADKMIENTKAIDGIIKYIEDSIVPDVEEVVRCKDCAHHNNCEIEIAGQFGDNSFCCLGERREYDGKPITGIE